MLNYNHILIFYERRLRIILFIIYLKDVGMFTIAYINYYTTDKLQNMYIKGVYIFLKINGSFLLQGPFITKVYMKTLMIVQENGTEQVDVFLKFYLVKKH